MKKILALILAAVMMLALVACGGSKTPDTTNATTPKTTEGAGTDTEISDENPIVDLNGKFDASAIKEGKVLVTSVGQSGDVDMMGAIFKKAGVEIETNKAATAQDLDGVGVVVAVVGASSKGLGAAGISVDDELSRTNDLMAACKTAGIPVILAHVGGASRTGGSSNQLIEAVLQGGASYALVVADGDVDGIFSNYCKTNNVPLTLIKSLANAVTPLGEIFK